MAQNFMSENPMLIPAPTADIKGCPNMSKNVDNILTDGHPYIFQGYHFLCLLCKKLPKYFKTRYDVRRHLQDQHSGVGFQCGLCGYLFNRRNMSHGCNAREEDMEYTVRETGVYGEEAKRLLRKFINEKQDSSWKFVEVGDEPDCQVPSLMSVVVKPKEPGRRPRPRKEKSPELLVEPEPISLEEPPRKVPRVETVRDLLKDLECSPSVSTISSVTGSENENENDNELEAWVTNTSDRDQQKGGGVTETEKQKEGLVDKNKKRGEKVTESGNKEIGDESEIRETEMQKDSDTEVVEQMKKKEKRKESGQVKETENKEMRKGSVEIEKKKENNVNKAEQTKTTEKGKETGNKKKKSECEEREMQKENNDKENVRDKNHEKENEKGQGEGDNRSRETVNEKKSNKSKQTEMIPGNRNKENQSVTENRNKEKRDLIQMSKEAGQERDIQIEKQSERNKMLEHSKTPQDKEEMKSQKDGRNQKEAKKQKNRCDEQKEKQKISTNNSGNKESKHDKENVKKTSSMKGAKVGKVSRNQTDKENKIGTEKKDSLSTEKHMNKGIQAENKKDKTERYCENDKTNLNQGENDKMHQKEKGNQTIKPKISMKEYQNRRQKDRQNEEVGEKDTSLNNDDELLLDQIMNDITNTYKPPELISPVCEREPDEDYSETARAVASISDQSLEEVIDNAYEIVGGCTYDALEVDVMEKEIQEAIEIVGEELIKESNDKEERKRKRKADVLENDTENEIQSETSDETEVENERQLHKENKKRRKAQEKEELKAYLRRTQESRIVLNIGGTRFETSKETLTTDPDSLFSLLFTDTEPPRSTVGNSFFIDRDPAHFRLILNYLRGGCSFSSDAVLPRERRYLLEIKTESEFYRLKGLKRLVKKRLERLSDTNGAE